MALVFNGVNFFFSPKGRLNRQPYNIFLIITFLMSLLFFEGMDYFIEKANPGALSHLEKTALELCTLEHKNLEKNMSRPSYINRCADKKALEKFLELSPVNRYIIYIVFLVEIVVMICPSIRRLHDRGRSGWWYLGFIGAAPIWWPIGFTAGILSSLTGLIALLWFIVETSFLRGTVGPNDYGPDPLA